jgi:hypothetical protein
MADTLLAKNIADYAAKGSHPYPADNIDPKLKLDKAYAFAFCRALLSDYAGNRLQIPFDFGTKRTYRELRAYAQGKQGNAKIKENFFGPGKKNSDGFYDTKVGVSWDGMDVMPKMYDVLRGINQKIEFRPEIRCVDPDALEAKIFDRSYLKHLIKAETAQLLGRAAYKPNSPVNMEELGLETESDVDLYFDSGAHSTWREIAAQAACNQCKIDSDYKTLQDMHFDDLITLSIMGGKNYIDRANGAVKQRYVDVENALIPYSRYPDFRNITRAGEVRDMSIGELREEYPHISADEWRLIAKKYRTQNSDYRMEAATNGFPNAAARQEEMNTYGMDPVNQIMLKVLDCQWLSTDVERYLVNQSPNRKFYKDVDFQYEVSNSDYKKGDRVKDRKVVKKYFAAWVIGTDLMLDYGVCEDVVYYGKSGNKIPKLDYFFAKTNNSSLVERCIGHIDDINLAVVKRRNALATLPPAPRMVIQQQLLDNVYLNGIKQEPEDLIQTLIERGYLVVNNLDDHNRPIFQNAKAVEFIPINVIQDITMFTNEIKEGIDRIREVTGLNQATDASTPEQYTGLGKTQIAVGASNNALFPTFNAYSYYFTPAFDDVVKKYQILARKRKEQGGVKIISSRLGTTATEILSLDADFSNSDYHMKTVMEYTEDQRQMLLQQIGQFNAQNGQTGGTFGLSYAEYMYIFNMIMAGNFQLAMFMIAQAERKKALAQRRKEIQDQQTNIQNQISSNQSAETEKRKSLIAEENAKRLTAQITETEKRKTQLMKDIAAVQQANALAPGGIINTELLQQFLAETDQVLQGLQAQVLQQGIEDTQNEMQGQQGPDMGQQGENNPQMVA